MTIFDYIWCNLTLFIWLYLTYFDHDFSEVGGFPKMINYLTIFDAFWRPIFRCRRFSKKMLHYLTIFDVFWRSNGTFETFVETFLRHYLIWLYLTLFDKLLIWCYLTGVFIWRYLTLFDSRIWQFGRFLTKFDLIWQNFWQNTNFSLIKSKNKLRIRLFHDFKVENQQILLKNLTFFDFFWLFLTKLTF